MDVTLERAAGAMLRGTPWVVVRFGFYFKGKRRGLGGFKQRRGMPVLGFNMTPPSSRGGRTVRG